jgi:hypothetical protein
MGLAQGPGGVDLADDFAGRLDYALLARTAQVHVALGPLAGREQTLAVGVAQQQPFVFQAGHHAPGRVRNDEGLAFDQRNLGRGAFEVPGGDDRIVGVDHGRFGRPVEEVGRMAHEILVQGVLAGDQDHGRFPKCPADPPPALPGRHDRPG